MNKDLVIFDLDGTLTDNSHRQKYVLGKQKDWGSFFEAQPLDRPKLNIVRLFQSLEISNQFKLMIVTARPERYRAVTEAWLSKHDIFPERVIMRKDGDRRADDIVKREILYTLKEEEFAIVFVVDDRKSVVQMWRSEGVTCLQCADHDF
jgi:phosphoglycolate phosphatase-like HAD superfamily hydrolase